MSLFYVLIEILFYSKMKASRSRFIYHCRENLKILTILKIPPDPLSYETLASKKPKERKPNQNLKINRVLANGQKLRFSKGEKKPASFQVSILPDFVRDDAQRPN